jgi:aspartate aminotransferase
MISEKMKALGVKKSVIREIFEYAKHRKAEIGAENVFDYSIGNPSVPSPDIVKETLTSLLTEKDPAILHGYTSAQGDLGVRKSIADYLNATYSAGVSEDLIYLTVGAAAALTISLNAVLADNANEEVIVFAPFFPEYKVFIERRAVNSSPFPQKHPIFKSTLMLLKKQSPLKPKRSSSILQTTRRASFYRKIPSASSARFWKPPKKLTDIPSISSRTSLTASLFTATSRFLT